MASTKKDKSKIIKAHQVHEADTGSAQVQIAILTERLNNLQDHFQAHKKDKHSKVGLFKMIGDRRKLLEYLKNTNEPEYKKLIEKLGLRK